VFHLFQNVPVRIHRQPDRGVSEQLHDEARVDPLRKEQSRGGVAEIVESYTRQRSRFQDRVGADPGASGATRVAGSRNFKDSYAPYFQRVEIAFSTAGRIVSKEELAHLGLIADPRQQASAAAHSTYSELPRGSEGYFSPNRRPAVRKWPNYTRCVEGAPEARAGGRAAVSRADFTWCMIAIDWGWSIEETAARLMQQSPKAFESCMPCSPRGVQQP